MFKRLLVEEWQNGFQFAASLIFMGIFAVIVVRAILMPRHRIDHLSKLPLEKDSNEPR